MNSEPPNYNYSGIQELWTIEKQLTVYNEDIVLKISKFLKPNDSVLEYGAGIGSLARLMRSLKNITPDCLEIDKQLQITLIDRGFPTYGSVTELTKTYDAVYISNVLEHIDDDINALTLLRPVIKEDGLLIIYVPALEFLYSEFDFSVGHFRRYNKATLGNVLLAANYEIISYQYVDSIGVFVWLLLKLRGFSETHKASFDNNESHPSFELYDKYVYPISRFLDNLGFKYLLGKNILMVARKKIPS